MPPRLHEVAQDGVLSQLPAGFLAVQPFHQDETVSIASHQACVRRQFTNTVQIDQRGTMNPDKSGGAKLTLEFREAHAMQIGFRSRVQFDINARSLDPVDVVYLHNNDASIIPDGHPVRHPAAVREVLKQRCEPVVGSVRSLTRQLRFGALQRLPTLT